MALFLEVHGGQVIGSVQSAHQASLEECSTRAVRYLRYWVGRMAEEVFCLVEAPDRGALEAVHGASHGGQAEAIVELPYAPAFIP